MIPMPGKIKYGKITACVFITALIWVWADLALDEELPDKPATIVVDESANPKLWVSFSAGRLTAGQTPLAAGEAFGVAGSADVRITLSGPATVVAAQGRRLKEGKRLEFDFDAAQQGMGKPGTYPLALLPFLQKNKQIRRLGLKVKSCEPDTLTVNVVGLVEKLLLVRCVDEDQNPIETASIKPAQVAMFVPEDWVGDARVQLMRREIEQARLTAVAKTPYIELAVGRPRQAQMAVEIAIPPAEDLLRPETITAATLGIALSPTLQGKYKVEVTNLNEVMSPIAIRATADARRAYQLQPLPSMILYIFDDDRKTAAEQRRQVVYNFPDEYLRKDEIVLNQQPVVARFKLIPLSPGRVGGP